MYHPPPLPTLTQYTAAYPLIHYQQPPSAANGYGWHGNGYGWQADPSAWHTAPLYPNLDEPAAEEPLIQSEKVEKVESWSGLTEIGAPLLVSARQIVDIRVNYGAISSKPTLGGERFMQSGDYNRREQPSAPIQPPADVEEAIEKRTAEPEKYPGQNQEYHLNLPNQGKPKKKSGCFGCRKKSNTPKPAKPKKGVGPPKVAAEATPTV